MCAGGAPEKSHWSMPHGYMVDAALVFCTESKCPAAKQCMFQTSGCARPERIDLHGTDGNVDWLLEKVGMGATRPKV